MTLTSFCTAKNKLGRLLLFGALVCGVIFATVPASAADPSNLLHNSSTTGSTKWGGNWGTATGKYGQFTCLTCHSRSTANIKRVKTTLQAPVGPDQFPVQAATGTLSFTDARDGFADFGHDADAHAASSKICEGCHTYDASGSNGVKFHAYDMSAGGADLGHYNGADCTKCHKHNQGFKASCTSCHGNPPTAATAGGPDGLANDPAVTGSATYGAHPKHVTTLGYGCNTCHTGWETNGEMPKNGNINIGFSAYSRTIGTYNGRSGGGGYTAAAGTTVNTTGALTCSLYCHGAGTPQWTAAATVACGDCHGKTLAYSDARDGAPEGSAGNSGKDLSGATSGYKVGKHANHLDDSFAATGDYCALCHPTTGHAGNLDGTVHISLNAAAGGSAAWAAGSPGTCSNMTCHGNAQWDSAAAGGCNFCHGSGATGQYWPDGAGASPPYYDNQAGAHNNHVLAIGQYLGYGSYTPTMYSDVQQKAICAFCHGTDPGESGHTTNGGSDNRVDVAGAGSFKKFTGAAASAADTASLAYSTANANCSNLACHNQVATPSGASNWNSPPAANCTTLCHPTGSYTNRHNTHVTTKGYACTQCHSSHGTNYKHTDGLVQLVWNNAGGAAVSFENTFGGASVTYSQAAPLPYKDNTWGTCASAACHNNKTTPAWNAAATGSCMTCHTRSTTGNNPSSGLHYGSTAPTVSATWHDDSLAGGCAACHTTLAAQSTHINGTFTGNGTTVGNRTIMGLFATYQSSGSDNVGTCATSCHSGSGDNGTWARKWNSGIHYLSTGAECNGCHGGVDGIGWVAGVMNHDQNWNAPADAVSDEIIGNHGGNTNQLDRCRVCHVYNDTINNTYKTNAGGKIGWVGNTANNSTYHGNGKIDFNDKRGYSDVTFNCSSTCHVDNTNHAMADSGWPVATITGSPDLGCTDCHTGSGTGAFKVGSASAHTKVGTRAGYNTFVGCTECHPGGANTHKKNGVATVVAIPNKTTVGINYSHLVDTGVNGFVLGGAKTSGTTEAEICWNCHSNLTYQTTALSEWGTNTQANTGSSTYNYGTLGGTSSTNWLGTWNGSTGTTATWSSSVANFAYKSSTIRSTHSVNDSVSAAGLDTVDKIRCSYCHDVHNLNLATGDTLTGSPYLRGTWKGNPYREDGAPQASSTYTAYDWGAVPRGSTANNELGGYQIDQNNGNPTSSWTLANSAGLCTMCHTTDVNNMNKFGTAANAWVGSNGHSNAVIGGTGSNKSNIFRTSDRAPSGLTTTGAKPDMAYKNHGSSAGYGFRGPDGRAFRLQPYMTAIQSGNSSRPYAGQYYQWGATVDNTTTDVLYHKFSCSKCHNPHASRLPRLMITNCLDTKQNTWDDPRSGMQAVSVGNSNNYGVTLNATSAPDNWNRTWSNTTSAQNCHRLKGDNRTTGAAPGFGAGWNLITPWNLTTKNPDNGTIP